MNRFVQGRLAAYRTAGGWLLLWMFLSGDALATSSDSLERLILSPAERRLLARARENTSPESFITTRQMAGEIHRRDGYRVRWSRDDANGKLREENDPRLAAIPVGRHFDASTRRAIPDNPALSGWVRKNP